MEIFLHENFLKLKLFVIENNQNGIFLMELFLFELNLMEIIDKRKISLRNTFCN